MDTFLLGKGNCCRFSDHVKKSKRATKDKTCCLMANSKFFTYMLKSELFAKKKNKRIALKHFKFSENRCPKE